MRHLMAPRQWPARLTLVLVSVSALQCMMHASLVVYTSCLDVAHNRCRSCNTEEQLSATEIKIC